MYFFGGYRQAIGCSATNYEMVHLTDVCFFCNAVDTLPATGNTLHVSRNDQLCYSYKHCLEAIRLKGT